MDSRLKQRTPAFLLLFVCLDLVALGCQRAAQPVTGFADESVRVVSWNVRKCECGVETIIAELRRLDADIACLQEIIEQQDGARESNQAKRIGEALSMHVYSRGAPLRDGRVQCMAILSRVPLRQMAVLDAGTGRNYAVTAVVNWQGRPVRLVSVHLSGTYRVNWRHIVQTGRKRAREGRDLVSRLRGWSNLVIVAGDFNTTPGTPFYDSIASELLAAPEEATYPALKPFLALDHVFYSATLELRHAEADASVASDHRPIIAELALTTP